VDRHPSSTRLGTCSGDLSAAIAARRPDDDELRGLAHGLLGGVVTMHAAELLHRDLKPANIALRDGRFNDPVILDLGLAKLLDIESITRYPAHVGTAMYMAPEQLRAERALRASDLWAIGVVLFEAATGTHPFFAEGETLTWDELFARLRNPPDVPDSIPADVVDLICRCLSDPPHKRGTVAKALDRLEQESEFDAS
jgi:serine/threonine protein kinase